MRISDWSSDVCSSDLSSAIAAACAAGFSATTDFARVGEVDALILCVPTPLTKHREPDLSFVLDTLRSLLPYLRKGQVVSLESRSEEHTSELQSLMRTSYAVFCLKKKKLIVHMLRTSLTHS